MNNKSLKILYWILPLLNIVWVLLLYYSWYPITMLLNKDVTTEINQMYYEPPMPFLMPIILIVISIPLFLYLFICYRWYSKWVIYGMTVLLIIPFVYDLITGNYFDGCRKIGTDILILSAYALSFFPWLGLELFTLFKIKKSGRIK